MLLPSTPESWGMKLVAQETSFFVLAVVENSPAFHQYEIFHAIQQHKKFDHPFHLIIH